LPRVETTVLLACSGATSASLAPQVHDLAVLQPSDIFAVTLTIGGNDIGFGPVVADCFRPDRECVRDGTLADAFRKITASLPKWEGDYRAVVNADPGAELFVVGYPLLLPLQQSDGVECKWLTPKKRLYLYALNEELNSRIEQAVRNVVENAPDPDATPIDFVSVSSALRAHELCSKDSWVNDINYLGLLDNQEGHPNIHGQEAIAKVVASAIAGRSG